MPLVLTLRVGEEVFVGERPFRLQQLLTAGAKSAVKMLDVGGEKEHRLIAGESREVLPNVFMSVGDRTTSVSARITIQAPRSVVILSGEKYRALKQAGETIYSQATGNTASKEEYRIGRDIIARARDLGIYGETADARLREMLRLSSPISMPGYNRRFQQYVLMVDEGLNVVGIDRLSKEEQNYYDQRRYQQRLDEEGTAPGEAEVEWKDGSHRTDGGSGRYRDKFKR
jgi:sRNA-binding carbon storage regulator CsrA